MGTKINLCEMSAIGKEPLTVIGMVASMPFYFVASQMRRLLAMDFVRVRDFSMCADGSQDECKDYPTYFYLDSDKGLLYLMMDNTEPLVKNLKSSNILVFVIGRDCEKMTESLVRDLRGLSSVAYCKKYYPSQAEIEQANVESNDVKAVQLDVFGQKTQNPYQNIKEKRRNIVKNMQIDEQRIDALKEDVEYNLEFNMDNDVYIDE